jgi:3-deoxy-D-manno-octulosonate 8-phosphate phosphatase (KDO 8-P phosphatase)
MMLEKFKEVQAFILDVDGVLTDGTVHVTESGEQLRTMNVKDGYAVKKAVKRGYEVVVISGGSSEGVRHRMKGLGVKHIFLGVANKMEVFQELVQKGIIQPETTLSMGDDEPDCKLMEACGAGACPADAVECIKEKADYVSGKDGGKAFVREVLEMVLKVQNTWERES